MKKIITFLFSIFGMTAISFAQPFSDLSKPVLIAHAGGSLYGRTYLNSKEAVENAIKNGFQYIELDLMETTDHEIVAAHDWITFHRLTSGVEQNAAISLSEAKQRKILGNQTVLTTKEIRNIFVNNPNLYLVTDKIQNIDLLLEKFKDFKDRIVMEVFTIDKYNEAISKGIPYPAYYVRNLDENYQNVEKYGIKMITLSSDRVEKRMEWFKNHPDVITLAFSVGKDRQANTAESIKNLFPYINAWYTDYLTPQDIQ